jgi:hypothetical protein
MLFDVPVESQDYELTSSDFDLILTDDDPDLRLNPQFWPSFQVKIAPERPEYGQQTLLLNINANVYKSQEFKQLLRETGDKGWFLDQTYKNFTADRAASFLQFLVGS